MRGRGRLGSAALLVCVGVVAPTLARAETVYVPVGGRPVAIGDGRVVCADTPPPDTRSRTTATSGADLGEASCQVSPVYFPFESAELTTETRDTLVRDAHCIEAYPEPTSARGRRTAG